MTMALVKKSPTNVLPLTFGALVEKIRQTLAEGRARAEEAVDLERARTYWETGRWIHVYELKGKDRAKYGERVIPNLAEETGLGITLIHEMLLFYKTFPIFYARKKLGWSHFRAVLRVKDERQRRALLETAVKKNWTSRQLEAAVRKISPRLLSGPDGGEAVVVDGKPHTGASKDGKKLIPRKGKFFTYQIVRPQNMHEGPGGYSLDLGFKIRHEIDFYGIRNPRPGEVVQVVRTKKDSSGDRYKVTRADNLKRSDLYTYKAKAQIYHDADTFWADIDLGFRSWNEQKLRLRGIDAEELGEARGRKAAAYVKKVLSSVPFIVLTISGRDKFGRPLADVFYLPGTEDREKVLAEGRFLNQELLDLGLAKRNEK